MKKLLLLLLSILPALPSLARDFEYTYEGQTITYTVIDENAKTCKTKEGYGCPIVAGNNVYGDVVLPAHPVDGDVIFTLKEISHGSFYENSLSSILIPSTVTLIGQYAFTLCECLATVSIGNSVNTIEDFAFSVCTNIQNITIPASVINIGVNPFAGCISLRNVHVENNNQKFIDIDGVLFSRDMTKLVCFPPASKQSEYTIPEFVNEIGPFAFNECSGLKYVYIPESVCKIGEVAFDGCSSLISIAIPPSVTEINEDVFGFCTSLSEVILPFSILRIGDLAFAECINLSSIGIPNSVSEIGEYAFWGCTALKSVIIPNSVQKIGSKAFADCLILSSVIYLADNPICAGQLPFSEDIYENATLNYLKSAEDKIATTEPWCLFKNRVARDADFVDGIAEVQGAAEAKTAVYDLRGAKVGESLDGLPAGIYVIREGSKTTKIKI